MIDDHIFYNCQVTLDDGTSIKIAANYLHNNQFDNWYGWSCNAGHTRLHITDKNQIFSGECCNDYLGNFTDGWELLKDSTVCKKQRCTGCTDDLLVEKNKNNTIR